MGAEKWLDIELWDSVHDCFKVLKSVVIALRQHILERTRFLCTIWTGHAQLQLLWEMNSRGISNEALESSDLHCSIPMKGMVDSFNVSVAAGLLMHHAYIHGKGRIAVQDEGYTFGVATSALPMCMPRTFDALDAADCPYS
ncbi:hypothetical protein HAX54_052389 [Datura stramonium]|uniref:tRNA/rRNA methyltransferase SpoU type domain-containing protein n=1 Tax=Datura stramonium TaxID=4076 RepID=A0ABS8WNF2_DATST|nr:hypothetical protein [Datura stramonium]